MDINTMGNMPQNDAEKSQAGTNLVIVILVLIIVVAGVKLLMSSKSVIAPAQDTAAEATSTETSVAEIETEIPTGIDINPATTTVLPVGKGEVAFSVLAKDAVAVRAIYVHNLARVAEGDAAWIQVYDGYKAVPAGQSTLVFTVSLSAIQYDEVRVRTLNVATGIPDEVVKMMPITVTANENSLVTIEL